MVQLLVLMIRMVRCGISVVLLIQSNDYVARVDDVDHEVDVDCPYIGNETQHLE